MSTTNTATDSAGVQARAAAVLNAAFGICLGCQLYPLLTRVRPAAENP